MKRNKIKLKNHNPQQDVQNENLGQILTKIEMWKQLLNSGKAENVLLKSQLADILRNNFHQSFLEEMEDFQSRFILEDESIDSLREEVNELDILRSTDVWGSEKSEQLLNSRMKKLDENIVLFTTRFNRLKFSFECFQHKLNGKPQAKF